MSDLFEMLAQAKSQDRGPLADVKALGGTLNSIIGGYRAQDEFNRQQKLKDFMDTNVPDKPLHRIFGKAAPAMTWNQFGAISKDAPLLKEPNNLADMKQFAALASGGDPEKFTRLMQMFAQNDDDGDGKMSMTPGMASVIRALNPAKVKATKDTAELRAVQANLQAQLKTDLSEADRRIAQENLQMINDRLASSGGVKLKKAPPKPATPAGPAGLNTGEQAAVKALIDALSK